VEFEGFGPSCNSDSPLLPIFLWAVVFLVSLWDRNK